MGTVKVALAAGIVAMAALGDETLPKQPVELGMVNWRRNYDEAAAEAKRAGKPLLILFQEVPG